MKRKTTTRRRPELSRLDIIKIIAAPRGATDSRRNVIHLRGLKLDGLDLSGLNLEWVDFTKSSMIGCNFRGADLSGAQFWWTNCAGSDFRECDMEGVCVSRAVSIQHGNFSNATFRGVSLIGAQAESANFEGADLRETCFRDAHMADAIFAEACVTDASFRGAILREGAFVAVAPSSRVDMGGVTWWARHGSDQAKTIEPKDRVYDSIVGGKVKGGTR